MTAAAKTPPMIAPGILCPKCKGAMLDERGTKRSDKSPDYTCANMLCTDPSGKYRTAIWEKDAKANGNTQTTTQVPGAPAPQDASVKPKMRDAYKSLTEWVLEQVAPLYDEVGLPLTSEAAAACVQTLFIQACKSGKVE